MTALKRDIIVVGCSAGGVEMLPQLLHALPRDLPASITIVQHLAATPDPYLVSILERGTELPVGWAEQGSKVVNGHIYVAPPDTHTMFEDGHLVLSSAARENHSRPSIDKLFRSAAAFHGSRTIGVLLTGMLDDGVAGLQAIQKAGGVTLVQDPEEAPYPELPSRALLAAAADRALPILGIAAALMELVGAPVANGHPTRDVVIEAALDRAEVGTPEEMSALGPQTAMACPDCCGPTWQLGSETTRRYRCYLGHVHTARDLLVRQGRAVEQALWSAVRSLGDRALSLETLARDSLHLDRPQTAELYKKRAEDSRKQATLARQFVLELVRSSANDQ
jgi:two-component system, chemotaxis family, protein-glutamate methylesterase/glutaminase